MMLHKAYALIRISADPIKFIEHRTQNEKQKKMENNENDAFQYYLNKRMRIVTPDFLRAWWFLRHHIQQWALRYFYEVCHHRMHISFLCFHHSSADSADYIAVDCLFVVFM